MVKDHELLAALLNMNDVHIRPERSNYLTAFLENEENGTLMARIVENAEKLATKWKKEDAIRDIMEQPLRIPNGTVGKPYEAVFDPEMAPYDQLTSFAWKGLDEIGLAYNHNEKKITGVPTQSGDINLILEFKIESEAAEPLRKPVTLIINPDPKSLWKNISTDKNDPYWKEDDVTVFERLHDRHVLVSSKRGRSHANIGSFREDDFGFKAIEGNWNLIVVADGAGSAKLSRKGSALTCTSVIDFFSEAAVIEKMLSFDELFFQYNKDKSEENERKVNQFVYNTLGNAALKTHKNLNAFAKAEGFSLKDLSSTLIFCLFKKYDNEYAILSFSVGDCPMAVLSKDIHQVTMLNWLDVGEYGGGTRFITMPEIFQHEKFASRLGFTHVEDFSYLIMMSDGIYDPKFVVESALPKIEKWHEFLSDLNGQNPEGKKVTLDPKNPQIKEELSGWMDFWSPGNHDDRTLAIVF
jgi:serine/threonine protein phosphatase PrpC